MADDLPDDVLADVRGKVKELSAQREKVRADLGIVQASKVMTESLSEKFERVTALADRLTEVFRHAEPAQLSEVFHELIDRIECHFTTEQRGKYKKASFVKGVICLTENSWSQSSFLLRTARYSR
jgi:hypothetical protein